MTPYEFWFRRNLSCHFSEFGNASLMSDKLEPKAEKCIFIRYPKETVGYTLYLRSEGKVFVAKNGSFLEKEFLSKELSGRKVELDEVIEPSLQLDGSTTQKDVSVGPTPNEEEVNDDDHDTSDQVTTEPRRSTRTRTAPEWYVNHVLKVMLLDNNEPTSYEEAMEGPDSNKWLGAKKSEKGSMYENQVWTLVDLPVERQAVEYKWIFKKKTNTNGKCHHL